MAAGGAGAVCCGDKRQDEAQGDGKIQDDRTRTRAGHGKGMEAGKSPCRWCLYYIAGIVILLFSDEWDGVGQMGAGVGAAEEARGVAHAPH